MTLCSVPTIKGKVRELKTQTAQETQTDGAQHFLQTGGEKSEVGYSDYTEDAGLGPESRYKSYKPLKIHSTLPWRAATVSYLSQPE